MDNLDQHSNTPAKDNSNNNNHNDLHSDDSCTTDPDVKLTPAAENRRGAKRRIIDESLLNEDEARRLEARRAYNRQCASKARKRSKSLIATLQQQVEELSKDKTSLERTNEIMKAQLQLLEQQNRSLIMSQRAQSAPVLHAGASSFLGSMHGGGGQNLGQGGGNFPPVSLLESLSAQGRFSGLQGENQQGGTFNSGMPRVPASSGANGSGGLDPSKYYLN